MTSLVDRIKGKPPRQPVILSVDQLETVLTAHAYAGSHTLRAVSYVMCSCGKQVVGGFKELRRHTAEAIAELQK